MGKIWVGRKEAGRKYSISDGLDVGTGITVAGENGGRLYSRSQSGKVVMTIQENKSQAGLWCHKIEGLKSSEWQRLVIFLKLHVCHPWSWRRWKDGNLKNTNCLFNQKCITPYDPAILLPSIHPSEMKTYVHRGVTHDHTQRHCSEKSKPKKTRLSIH